MKLLENHNVHIVAHPTAILKRHNVTVPSEMKKLIAQKAADLGKILEVNSKYQVPDAEFINILRSYDVKLSYGSDSHSIEEM
jgi:histidinol phosphatase-like PHP family hydrolase